MVVGIFHFSGEEFRKIDMVVGELSLCISKG